MYKVVTEQKVPKSLDEVWDFFSNPQNLSKVTPEGVGFKMLGNPEPAMYVGMVIRYQIAPILGIPLDWATEITHIEHKKYFVDHQIIGPYKIWHHQHHFEEIAGGVLIRDIVHYALPLGPLGKLVHPLLVKPKLDEIFGFREAGVKKVLGAM